MRPLEARQLDFEPIGAKYACMRESSGGIDFISSGEMNTQCNISELDNDHPHGGRF
jgi:hypothetical protein